MVNKDELVCIGNLKQVCQGLLHGGRGYCHDLHVRFETGLEALARVTLVDDGRDVVFKARPIIMVACGEVHSSNARVQGMEDFQHVSMA